MSALEYTLTRSFPLRIFANLMQSEMARQRLIVEYLRLHLPKVIRATAQNPRAYQYRWISLFFQLSAQTDRLSLRSRKCVFYTLSESEKSSFSCVF